MSVTYLPDGSVFIEDPYDGRRKYIAKVDIKDNGVKVWTKWAAPTHKMLTGHFAVDRGAFDLIMDDDDILRVVTDEKEYLIGADKVFKSKVRDYGHGEQYFVPLSSFSSMTRLKSVGWKVRGTFDL